MHCLLVKLFIVTLFQIKESGSRCICQISDVSSDVWCRRHLH